MNGYLFEPNDPKGAIKATQRLLAAKDDQENLRNNARTEAEKWGWGAATRQLQDYYSRVVYQQSVAA